MRLKLAFAALFLVAALSASSQTVPAATRGGIPILVGGGFSEYDSDWNGNLGGGTLWIDVGVPHLPRLLHGLGVEVEGRDLNYTRSGFDPKLRQDTAEGGLIYRWNRYHNFRPYAKFLGGYGSIEFSDPRDPYYSHDTRTVLAPGGGVEYRVWGGLWVRGDYEYQFWPQMTARGALTPAGYTVGAVYDLSHLFGRR
jgi:opacity protein-like surface antigen